MLPKVKIHVMNTYTCSYTSFPTDAFPPQPVAKQTNSILGQMVILLILDARTAQADQQSVLAWAG